MLIAGAEVEGRAPLDVRLAGGRIVEIGPGLRAMRGEAVIEGRAGALLPGLHDHHIHLLSFAQALRSVRCDGPELRDARDLERALRAATPIGGWVRGVGYHESVAGELGREVLDRLGPELPVRVQHHSGALWVLNSAGIERLGLDHGVDAPGIDRDPSGRATGRLYDLDRWLGERLGDREVPDLRPVGARLARLGVTGVTDATVHNGPAERAMFERAVRDGALPQRVVLMGGLELGAGAHCRLGPHKVVLREGLELDAGALRASVRAARAREREIAIHCVTRAELVVAVAVLEEEGARAGDRIEHGAIAPPELVERIAALPVAVVTQPHFVHERGDRYRAEVDAVDRPWLYRLRGWLAAGVPLGGGSDAPFGDPDPWRAMRAAVERTTASGVELGPKERLTPERALALFLTPAESPGGAPRRVAKGQIADLCLLHVPWEQARSLLRSELVRAVFRAGVPLALEGGG